MVVDSSYDKHKVFEALADPLQKEPIEPIIALRKDAKIQQHGNTKAAPGSDPARDSQERTQGLETTKWVSSARSGRDADVSV